MEQRNQFIDILRGLAVIGVVFHHLWFIPYSSREVQFEILGTTIYPLIFNNGWLGVNLFFVLSGFVLFRIEISQSLKSTLEYYRVRAIRLLPIYFAFLLFISVIQKKQLPGLEYLFMQLTGFNSFVPWLWLPASLAIFWSIGIEIVFSLLLPLILLTSSKVGFWRMALCILVAAFAYRIIADHTWYQHFPNYPNPMINPVKDNLAGRLDDFIVGMAAAQFLREKRQLNFRWTLVGTLALLIVNLYGWNYVYDNTRTLPLTILVSALHSTFAISIFGLIVSLKNLELWSNRKFWLLVLSGQCCYSIYIVHGFILKYVSFEHDFKGVAIYLVATWVISLFMFVYIESSGIRKLPDWVKRFRP